MKITRTYPEGYKITYFHVLKIKTSMGIDVNIIKDKPLTIEYTLPENSTEEDIFIIGELIANIKHQDSYFTERGEQEKELPQFNEYIYNGVTYVPMYIKEEEFFKTERTETINTDEESVIHMNGHMYIQEGIMHQHFKPKRSYYPKPISFPVDEKTEIAFIESL